MSLTPVPRFSSIISILALLAGTSGLSADTAPPPNDPALDPALEVDLVEPAASGHPRLLFSASEIPGLQAAIQEPPVAAHWDRVVGYLSACVPWTGDNPAFLSNATDGQRQGLWRMPTVALHYVLTGNQDSFDTTVRYMEQLLALDHWETTGEIDSGMSAGNILVGAALAFDWLHNDLEPGFREEFRRKLFYHARAMYHLGHLRKAGAVGYWQGDPQNNHRWHRNAGLVLATLAAYSGDPSEEWLLRQVYDELAFVAEWLPDDGTVHESSTYLVFGASHLALALVASDNCFGTDYLDLPFFRNVGPFRMQLVTPDLATVFQYGDSSMDLGAYNHFAYLSAARHGHGAVIDGLDEMFQRDPFAFDFGWFGVLWRGTAIPGESYRDLPRTSHFEDLGLTILRDSWRADGAAAMLKCGPFGGFRLNAYRNQNGYAYVNVAHNDPDANSFILYRDGAFLAETDRYSYSKYSENHNTILVDGKGQRTPGRPEGMMWTQPATGPTDMTTMAYVTKYRDGRDVTRVEGEAGGSYPELDRFRRNFLWVEGAYVLVLDDIRSSQSRDISWLMQGPDIAVLDEAGLDFRLRTDSGSASCDFSVLASVPATVRVVDSPADHRGNPIGNRQLRLGLTGDRIAVCSVYDLWENGPLGLSWEDGPEGRKIVAVTGPGIDDRWVWEVPEDGGEAEASAVVRAGVGWSAWSAGLTPGEDGESDNADNDNAANLVEYGLGTEGGVPGSRPTIRGLVPSGGDRLRLVLQMPRFGIHDVRYEIRVSPDLEDWTTIATKEGVDDWTGTGTARTTILDDNTVEVEFEDPVNVPAGASRYFRVRVTRI